MKGQGDVLQDAWAAGHIDPYNLGCADCFWRGGVVDFDKELFKRWLTGFGMGFVGAMLFTPGPILVWFICGVVLGFALMTVTSTGG